MLFATTEQELTSQASPKQNPDSSLEIRVKPCRVLLNEAVFQGSEGSRAQTDNALLRDPPSTCAGKATRSA
jgi:hypothetical protein